MVNHKVYRRTGIAGANNTRYGRTRLQLLPAGILH
eukprot:SAG31_NODE_2576_length_5452_cov_2.351018_4_plen_35_part_00